MWHCCVTALSFSPTRHATMLLTAFKPLTRLFKETPHSNYATKITSLYFFGRCRILRNSWSCPSSYLLIFLLFAQLQAFFLPPPPHLICVKRFVLIAAESCIVLSLTHGVAFREEAEREINYSVLNVHVCPSFNQGKSYCTATLWGYWEKKLIFNGSDQEIIVATGRQFLGLITAHAAFN